MGNTVSSLSRRLKLCYAVGQVGWSIMIGCINIWMVWFYNPTDISGIFPFIPQGSVLGVFTIIGLLTMIGRLIDAVTDPWIASLSDRSSHSDGRRIPFMRIGGIFMALFGVLIFMAPFSENQTANTIFVALSLFAFYFFFTLYVTPYLSLIPELGKTPEEKLDLSTYVSVMWFIGFGIASSASYIWRGFELLGLTKIASIRLTLMILAVAACIMLYIPVFFLKERKYSEAVPTYLSVRQSMRKTFLDGNYRIFVIADLIYWFGVTIIQTGMVYYITVLLNLPETMTTTITIATGLFSFILFPVVNFTAKKAGKKKMVIYGFVMFLTAFTYTGTLGLINIPPYIAAFGIVPLAGIPMAIFGILPNSIVADAAERHFRREGLNQEAMYYGVRTFMQKLGQTIGVLFFSSFLLLGKTSLDMTGIRVTSFAAACASIVALLVFIKYRD